MEDLLLKVGSQAANFAIRSGLGYASKFAFVQVSKFIQVAQSTRLKLICREFPMESRQSWRR
jgi:hypothetical protein